MYMIVNKLLINIDLLFFELNNQMKSVTSILIHYFNLIHLLYYAT